jgi:hypothetical protein
MADDLLGESGLRQGGIVDAARASTMVDEHDILRADYTDQLLVLAGFQVCAEQYDFALT